MKTHYVTLGNLFIDPPLGPFVYVTGAQIYFFFLWITMVEYQKTPVVNAAFALTALPDISNVLPISRSVLTCFLLAVFFILGVIPMLNRTLYFFVFVWHKLSRPNFERESWFEGEVGLAPTFFSLWD